LLSSLGRVKGDSHVGNKLAEVLYHQTQDKESRRFPAELRKVAERKLDSLNAARYLEDLRFPPGNRLEALKGLVPASTASA